MGESLRVGDVECYRADPDGDPRGLVVLIHEIWGLTGHIRAVADRFADEGWAVLAPDLLSDVGTTPEVGEELMGIMQSDDEDLKLRNQPRLREAFGATRSPEYAAEALRRLVEVVDAAAEEPGIDGRVVALGFCFGGGYALELAAEDRRVRAAVSFYGSPLTAERLRGLRAPLLGLYGDQDERLMESLPQFVQDAESADADLTTRVYAGAGHAFFNDTGANYVADAAEDAWATSMDFLDRAVPRA